MSQTITAAIAPATAPTTWPKISFAGVNKFYGDNRARTATTLALDDFDLDIAPEEIVSIVGPTGCSKSTRMNIVNLPAPLLRTAFKSDSIDAGIAWSPYSMALDAEGFRVVSWDPDYTPGGVCPRMTGVRPAFIKKHPEIGMKLLQVDAMASEAVAKDPQIAVHALVKRLGLTPAVAMASIARFYLQRPTFAQQLDPASALSLTSKEGGLAGKLQLAMQVCCTRRKAFRS